MSRQRLIVLALVGVLAATLPATVSAEPETLPRDLERFAVEMEGLFGDLLGSSPAPPVFQAHGDELYSLSWRITDAARDRFQASGAKALTTLANGHQLTDPSSLTTLINGVVATVGFDYNFWFAVINITADDMNKKTTNKIKGPGPNFTRVDDLDYNAGAVTLYWFNKEDSYGRNGVFTFITKVTGGGGAKSKALAQE